MRSAQISFTTQHFAGTLIETNDGEYTFKYVDDYVQNYPNQFITLPCL